MSSKAETSAHSCRPPLPVDHGWAWMITLGAFINTWFAFSFIRSLSIFFLEFLDKFEQSATMTTLPFGLNTAAFSASALVVPPVLLTRFSVRSVSLVGAVVNALSIIGMAFSPNMIWFNVMFIALGISHPLIFISQVALLGVYFKKRLSLAVACANLGLSVGVMCGPPFTQFLLNTYGLAGALLIHGGLNLNNIAACLLFRHPDVYAPLMDNTADDTEAVLSPTNGPECQLSVKSLNFKFEGKNDHALNENGNVSLTITNEEEGDPLVKRKTSECKIDPSNPRLRCLKENDFPARSSSLKSLNYGNANGNWHITTTNGKNHAGSERNIARPKTSLTDAFTSGSMWKIIDVISSSKSLKYLSHSSLCLDKVMFPMSRKTSNDCLSQASQILTVEKVEIISLNVSPDQSHEDFPLSTHTKQTTVKNAVCCHPVKLLLLTMAGFGVNTQCAAAYMPSLGHEQGLLREQLPFLMTIIGACDLFKLAIGYFADQGWVRRIHIVCVCQLIMAVSFQFTSFFHGLVPIIILCVIFGANTGVLHVLLPGITADLLGPAYIGQIMSFYFLINGVVMSLTHVLIGSLKDETGSFIGGYHFIGGLFLLSVVIILLEPVAMSFSPDERKVNGENNGKSFS